MEVDALHGRRIKITKDPLLKKQKRTVGDLTGHETVIKKRRIKV